MFDVSQAGRPEYPEVSPGALEQLRATRPWVFVVAVAVTFLGLIGVGFGCLAMVGGLVGSLGGGRLSDGPPMMLVGLIYIVMTAAVYVAPGVLLFRYGMSIGQALDARTSAGLETALGRQRTF